MVQTAIGLKKTRIDFLRHYESNNELPVNVNVSTGGSVAAGSAHGGVLRLSLTAAQTAAASVGGPISLIPSKATCVGITCLLKCSDVSVASFFFGLSDSNGDAVIIEDEDGALNTVPTDAVGILFEGEQDLTPQRIAVINNSDGVQAALSPAEDLEDNKKVELRVMAWRSGLAEFFVNGRRVANVTDYYDPTEEYCFVFGADGRGSAYTVDIDHFDIETEVAE